ncbi:CU044_5270 family protein [Streptosporangium roseum]|uniref:CU044_5270 family protein n=1 Tax=Streptosporangium roseum TaxID=2001 RepID=UPI0004CD80D7|nr:CU044_5270 family protein [Streptosporangium roseum]
MNLDDLARVHDEDLRGEPAGQTSGAGAQTLLASIMSEPPARGGRPRATWLRGPVPWLASAASVAATVLVVTMVTAPNEQRPAPPPAASSGAQPSARQMLLAAATAVAATKAPVSGAYWRTSTVSGRDAISPDRGYVIRRLFSKDEWLARRPGAQSWWVTQSLGVKPLTPEDQTAWRKAGSPTRWKYPIDVTGYVGVNSSEVVRAEAEEKTASRLRGKWKGSGGSLTKELLTWDEIRRIPSGERELRAYLEQLLTAPAKGGSGQDPRRPDSALQEACMQIVFALPVAPAVRASAYRILATMPELKSLGRVKDPLGRTGEAFGYQMAPDFGRKTAFEVALVIDPATGLLLARTTTTTVELTGGRTAKTTSFTAYQRMGWTDAKPSLPAKRD